MYIRDNILLCKKASLRVNYSNPEHLAGNRRHPISRHVQSMIRTAKATASQMEGELAGPRCVSLDHVKVFWGNVFSDEVHRLWLVCTGLNTSPV